MFSKIDKILLVTTIVTLFFGLIIFGSAALGVLAINEAKFYSVIKSQLIFALVIGIIALFIGASIPYSFYKKYAYYIFIGALIFTALVFIPKLSQYHGGARRWIDLGSISIQPSESLKLAFTIFMAFWCVRYRNKFRDWKFGLLPYFVGLGLVSVVMVLQKDFGTLAVILMSSFAVFFTGGARLKHILIMIVISVLGFSALLYVRPYMMERIKTFINPSYDDRGASWQSNQSLIAIGAGGLFGRGLGQSIQKFTYLPEPIGDSVFAVLGEELGLAGIIIIFILYGILGFRGYFISFNSEDFFGLLLGVGITTIILSQALVNISAMLGVIPLTGIPLPFVSHGGTALVASLFEIGILLNISKKQNI